MTGQGVSRRELLRRAALAAGTLALPLRLAADGPGPVMTALSTYMASARERALPPAVIEKASYHVLDTIAAMVSGSELVPGRAALAFARAEAGRPVATVVGSTLLTGSMEAALVNGVLAHSDETDDSHGPSQSHPGAAVVPAALALGEAVGISGGQFLRAVVLGYDVGTRTTMALGGAAFREKSRRSTHAIAGTFGAAAAAGSVAGLTAPQMRWLLDYASQQAGGYAVWGRDTDHIEKGFVFGGMPARNGVTAALLVRAGWNGVDDVFSGDDNFLQRARARRRPCPARRRARRALRGGQHRHQEVERRHTHPGPARRDREPPPASGPSRPTTCRASWCAWPRRSAPWWTTAKCPTCACSTWWR